MDLRGTREQPRSPERKPGASPRADESPRERTLRLGKETNPQRDAHALREDRDKVFGEKKTGTAYFGLERGLPKAWGGKVSLAPDIDALPVHLAKLRGSEASQNLVLVSGLAHRAQDTCGSRGAARRAVDVASADIEQKEHDGLITPEEAASLRAALQGRYGQEVAALEPTLKLVDQNGGRLQTQVDQEELDASEAGLMALARGPLVESLVVEHMEHALCHDQPEAKPHWMRLKALKVWNKQLWTQKE